MTEPDAQPNLPPPPPDPPVPHGKEFGINKPTPFTGDRKKISTFIQEARIYLGINRHVYCTDETKIAFILSYMTEGEALQWKELYISNRTNTAGDILFPSYGQFLIDLREAFKQADRTGDAMNQLVNLKQGSKTAEEFVTEFRLLTGQAGLEVTSHSDHLHLIGLFRNGLRPQLARRILFGETVPKTIDGWAEKAIQFDTNYRMALAIIGQTGEQAPRNFKARNPWTPRTERRDPSAMEIDALSYEERTALMRKGACFKCKKTGHMAKDCPPGGNRNPQTPRKMTAKDLAAQIRAMTKGEREEFANLMMNEKEETGF